MHGIANSVQPQLNHCANVPPLGPKPGLLRSGGETSPAPQVDNFLEHHRHTPEMMSVPTVSFLPRTSSFVLRLGFAFDGSRFPGVLFRDAFFRNPLSWREKIQIPGSENRMADSTSRRVSEDPETDVAATTALGPDRGTATGLSTLRA